MTMKSRRSLVLLAALGACASPGARGQSTSDSEQLGRMHAYEVPMTANDSRADESAAVQEVGPGWIHVMGRGSVSVAPDHASVRVALESRAATAADAADQNAATMTRVLEAIRGLGLPGLEIQTTGYSINPEYRTTNDGRRNREIVAYFAVNNVEATISDVDAVGRLVDAAIEAGANRVNSITFFTADTEAARRQALDMAVRSAREEAEVIAAALGYELGAPLEVSGNAQRPIPRQAAAEMQLAARAATPIEVGDQAVTAEVTIRFALGPGSGD